MKKNTIIGFLNLLQEEGWKLSRTNYYQEGWLATANVRGVVGVTYTTSFCAGTAQVSPHLLIFLVTCHITF